ncbi:MAG: hypothetical protein WCH99_22315 [Verrucomicrobiota bacterium]
MKESLELLALIMALGMGGIGIVMILIANKQKNVQIQKAGVVLLIIGGVFIIPGWGYLYTSGFLRVPSPPPPPPTNAQIQEQKEIQARQKEKEEQEREANSPERLKQLETEKKWVGSCCDTAGLEMRQFLQALGLNHEVVVNSMDYDVTKDDIVGVKVYLSYIGADAQSNKDFQENLKQKLELIILDKLLIRYKKSQVIIGFGENKGNWDK